MEFIRVFVIYIRKFAFHKKTIEKALDFPFDISHVIPINRFRTSIKKFFLRDCNLFLFFITTICLRLLIYSCNFIADDEDTRVPLKNEVRSTNYSGERPRSVMSLGDKGSLLERSLAASDDTARPMLSIETTAE